MNKEKIADSFIKLLKIVEVLRGPEGCPWDKEQTHESLLPYFLEETYEVIESVEEKDWETFKEELGDIMLHIVLQTQIAKEEKKFTIIDSLENVNKKLIKRHPHVFGNKKTDVSFEAKQNWEAIKHKEKKRESRLDGVPSKLPALSRAYRLQQKASFVGFDWNNLSDVWNKLDEEIIELKNAIDLNHNKNIEEELGDVLFTIVNLGRHLDKHSEDVLRKTNKKFIKRFRQVEETIISRGKTLEESTTEEMNEIWDSLKG